MSIASTDADAFIERVDRLVDHRQQDAVDDEGREILGHGDGLAELADEFLDRLKVWSSVAMPRMSSTSSISGTGFMKWMPMNCSGRSVEAASRVIEIDEVLVPRIASGLEKRAELGEDLALDLLVLDRRLDHEVAVAEARQAVARRGCAAAPSLSCFGLIAPGFDAGGTGLPLIVGSAASTVSGD